MSKTNETTSRILDFFFRAGIFARRANVLPVPISRNGVIIGHRPGGISGFPDIFVLLPSTLGNFRGTFLGCEIKTGKDRLRESQKGFHSQARSMGAIIFVVKDFDDFKRQWDALKIG